MCLDSGSDNIMRPKYESEDEAQFIHVRVELASGEVIEMKANSTGTLICEKSVQSIVPLVPVLESLGYRLAQEGTEGTMKLRRNGEVIELLRDNKVLECSQKDGEKLIKELEARKKPMQGHDELVGA